MRAWISHITGDDHHDDPVWGDARIWEGDVAEVEDQLPHTGLPLDQLAIGLGGAGTSWAHDFLARHRS